MSNDYLSAHDHELSELARQRQFYAEKYARAQELADCLDLWTQRLADALFLTLVDSGAHGAECSGVLRDYRDWVREWEARS
ncbi:MAG: hypothetical protein LW627_11385 [Ilumatobacteraceae bacterium]|jgi:hypothetical protein|nr:hypothetical protein [Ilumatobacteraceae bacterium]